MANALGPYYVRINYHSLSAPHSMTIPTLAWNPDGGVGTFETWAAGAIAADTMVEALITTFLPLSDPGVVYDNFTVFKQLLPTDTPLPMVNVGLTGAVGSNASATWGTAVEVIMVARTAAFGIAKLDFLDASSGNNFDPILVLAAPFDDVFDEWTADTNGWSGRDNSKPSTFLKITKNLNQKLRKEYRLD